MNAEAVLREVLTEQAGEVRPGTGDPWERVVRADRRGRSARRAAGAALLVAAVVAGTGTATRPWARPGAPASDGPTVRQTTAPATRQAPGDAWFDEALRGAVGPGVAAPSAALHAAARDALTTLTAELGAEPGDASPRVLWLGRITEDRDDSMVVVAAGAPGADRHLLARGLEGDTVVWTHRATIAADGSGDDTPSAWRVPIDGGAGDALAWFSPGPGKVMAEWEGDGLISADRGGWVRVPAGEQATLRTMERDGVVDWDYSFPGKD